MEDRELLQYAVKAKEFAYVPYSKFRVGAALVTKSGKIFTGCNVECASFGGTNCAERTAIFKAVSEGYTDFEAIAVTSDKEDYTFPCGICRQVIAEFGANIKVIVGNAEGEIKKYTASDLLPHSFTGKDIPNKGER